MNILVINGPNLNMLGHRESEHYGTLTLKEIETKLVESFSDDSFSFFQSNHEGELIEKIHEVVSDPTIHGLIINSGAFTHTSVAIADAIRAISTPVIEVHISNTHQRENFRHHSFLSAAVKGVILGLGMDSYRLALEHFRG